MKLIKFLLQKIIIVETMLIILYIAYLIFNIDIYIINLIITVGLKYLTPISIISLILYIIISLLTSKIIETIIGVVIGGIILYYIFTYML